MTAVAGFRCKDGVVICADRQITSPGFFKYHDTKLTASYDILWSLAFAYSGEAGIADEAREKIMKLLEGSFRRLDKETVFNAADEVLTAMGRPYTDLGFQMFIAVAPLQESSALIKFDGRALQHATGANYLGLGNSPLVRFLSETLYAPSLKVKEGSLIAAYLIKKAVQYLDGCGGPIDIAILRDYEAECTSIPSTVLNSWTETMEQQETRLRDLLIQPFSSLPSEP